MKISAKRVITNLLRVEPRVLFHKDLQGTGPKVECHRDLQELRENFQNLKKRTKINPNKESCGTMNTTNGLQHCSLILNICFLQLFNVL